MTAGGRLYILAVDHRGSFEKMVGHDLEVLRAAKMLVWRGFLDALAHGAPREAAGILIDEQYGSAVAHEARKEVVVFALPVEKTGRDEFEFEHGDDFGPAIEAYDPTYAKALVRFNPEGDEKLNARQLVRLRGLSDWLRANDRRFLFELLVPPTDEQLRSVDRSSDRYDAELRPQLMQRAIEALQDAGIEPSLWKIEGVDDRDACSAIARTARRDGRDAVGCLVLGRGASVERVEDWLRAGAGADGYVGFAVGRSIFADAVREFASNPAGYDQQRGIAQISTRYRHFIAVYEEAEHLPPTATGLEQVTPS
jgi:myo-inositol catabolism protein IolC